MEFALSTHLFVSERLGSYLLDQVYAAGIRQFEIFAARQHLDYHDPNQVRDVGLWFKDRGVQLLLENIPNDLAAPARLIQFIQYTRLEDLKICFDTGHAHMTGGVQPAFELLKNRIVSTHVHDNRREKDDHLFPFDGGIDWEQTIRDFRTVDGQFPIVFELRHYSPEASSLARLRQVIERIEAIR